MCSHRKVTLWGLTGVILDLGVKAGRSDILTVLNLSTDEGSLSIHLALRLPSSEFCSFPRVDPMCVLLDLHLSVFRLVLI